MAGLKPFVFRTLLVPSINAGVNKEALTAVFNRFYLATAVRTRLALRILLRNLDLLVDMLFFATDFY